MSAFSLDLNGETVCSLLRSSFVAGIGSCSLFFLPSINFFHSNKKHIEPLIKKIKKEHIKPLGHARRSILSLSQPVSLLARVRFDSGYLTSSYREMEFKPMMLHKHQKKERKKEKEGGPVVGASLHI